ncbi:hypothetical protein AAKU67_004438, partial [Oxalobacteraceae bacterium GrIS 2.11]
RFLLSLICCHPFEDNSLNYPVVTVSNRGSTIDYRNSFQIKWGSNDLDYGFDFTKAMFWVLNCSNQYQSPTPIFNVADLFREMSRWNLSTGQFSKFIDDNNTEDFQNEEFMLQEMEEEFEEKKSDLIVISTELIKRVITGAGSICLFNGVITLASRENLIAKQFQTKLMGADDIHSAFDYDFSNAPFWFISKYSKDEPPSPIHELMDLVQCIKNFWVSGIYD